MTLPASAPPKAMVFLYSMVPLAEACRPASWTSAEVVVRVGQLTGRVGVDLEQRVARVAGRVPGVQHVLAAGRVRVAVVLALVDVEQVVGLGLAVVGDGRRGRGASGRPVEWRRRPAAGSAWPGCCRPRPNRWCRRRPARCCAPAGRRRCGCRWRTGSERRVGGVRVVGADVGGDAAAGGHGACPGSPRRPAGWPAAWPGPAGAWLRTAGAPPAARCRRVAPMAFIEPWTM